MVWIALALLNGPRFVIASSSRVCPTPRVSCRRRATPGSSTMPGSKARRLSAERGCYGPSRSVSLRRTSLRPPADQHRATSTGLTATWPAQQHVFHLGRRFRHRGRAARRRSRVPVGGIATFVDRGQLRNGNLLTTACLPRWCRLPPCRAFEHVCQRDRRVVHRDHPRGAAVESLVATP
jgi:hypothetical protein